MCGAGGEFAEESGLWFEFLMRITLLATAAFFYWAYGKIEEQENNNDENNEEK